MKRSIACLSLFTILFLMTSRSASAFPNDEYDDTQSHPLRVLAYLVHPIGYGLEWAVFRPIHWVVSRENSEKVFGHTPHGAEESRSTMTSWSSSSTTTTTNY